jgi:hypothetical protein
MKHAIVTDSYVVMHRPPETAVKVKSIHPTPHYTVLDNSIFDFPTSECQEPINQNASLSSSTSNRPIVLPKPLYTGAKAVDKDHVPQPLYARPLVLHISSMSVSAVASLVSAILNEAAIVQTRRLCLLLIRDSLLGVVDHEVYHL